MQFYTRFYPVTHDFMHCFNTLFYTCMLYFTSSLFTANYAIVYTVGILDYFTLVYTVYVLLHVPY